jgi:hypothetical protein
MVPKMKEMAVFTKLLLVVVRCHVIYLGVLGDS